MRFILYAFLLITPGISGCSFIKDLPKYQLANGYYTSKIFNTNKKVYVVNSEETIQVYPVSYGAYGLKIDTGMQKKIVLEKRKADSLKKNISFIQTSFDIDILTIPFKYRFRLNDFPRQLNANLNGAVYLGYRSDVYSVYYKNDPLGNSFRDVTHYGFSFGGFTGLGATAMNPWVTNNQIGVEYDGVVWSKGIAGIIAINNFTAGLALGWDQLLDANKKYWIYQKTPWIGFVFGLNLN